MNAFYNYMDLTIPLVNKLLKYPYYFWKFKSKIKVKNVYNVIHRYEEKTVRDVE